MIKKVNWSTSDGREVIVAIELVTSQIIDADGDKVAVGVSDMRISATLEGVDVSGWLRPVTGNPVVVASFGCIGITLDNYNRIKMAIAEVEATPEWRAKIAKQEKMDKESDDYDAHRAKMARIMEY